MAEKEEELREGRSEQEIELEEKVEEQREELEALRKTVELPKSNFRSNHCSFIHHYIILLKLISFIARTIFISCANRITNGSVGT